MKRNILKILIIALCIFIVQSDKVYAYNEPVSGDEEEQDPDYDPYEERNGQIFYRTAPDAELDYVPIASLTDEQKLQRLMEINTQWEFDADLIDWWIAFPCDDQMKYNYFVTREDVVFSKTTCNWVINNENFTMEQKVAYIRSRDFWYSDCLEILKWWYVNAGEPLSSYETTKLDASNYEQYMRMIYEEKYGKYNPDVIECVSTLDKSKRFYMSREDFNKALAEGMIQTKTIKFGIAGSTLSPTNLYYTSNYDAIAKKYKIWNTK